MRKIVLTPKNIDGLSRHQTSQIIYWVDNKESFAIVFDFDTSIEFVYESSQWHTYVIIKNILITNSPVGIPDKLFIHTPDEVDDYYIMLGDYEFKVIL